MNMNFNIQHQGQPGNPAMGQQQGFANFNIPQPPANANIEWTGWYEQGGQQTNMSIHNLFINNMRQLVGNGSDPIGNFTIQGSVAPNGQTTFTK
jgi:hypothetical protein